ncbi:hypothetical protein [Mesorhizobium sp. M0029]|uniref:hypothetical protein n=1 Tax=Mesorhizobium sp. M0029 TaxID=2956850 RepID=UPI00333AEF69
MQLKLRFPDEDNEQRPDPPAWEKLDAAALAKALGPARRIDRADAGSQGGRA